MTLHFKKCLALPWLIALILILGSNSCRTSDNAEVAADKNTRIKPGSISEKEAKYANRNAISADGNGSEQIKNPSTPVVDAEVRKPKNHPEGHKYAGYYNAKIMIKRGFDIKKNDGLCYSTKTLEIKPWGEMYNMVEEMKASVTGPQKVKRMQTLGWDIVGDSLKVFNPNSIEMFLIRHLEDGRIVLVGNNPTFVGTIVLEKYKEMQL